MDPDATRIAPDYTATLLELVHHPCAIEALPGRDQKGIACSLKFGVKACSQRYFDCMEPGSGC